MFDFDIYDATSKSENCPTKIKSLIDYIDGIFKEHDADPTQKATEY